MSTSAIKRSIKRISARAFVCPEAPGGGNPLTVFLCGQQQPALSAEKRFQLARTCEWESVIISPSPLHKSTPHFFFHMPSGEEVSFCAHAAIGACFVCANRCVFDANQSSKAAVEVKAREDDGDLTTISFHAGSGDETHHVATIRGKEAELSLNTQFSESALPSSGSGRDCATLHDILAQVGLTTSDILSNDDEENGASSWPTFVNSSIARTKTLIPIRSLER